MQELNGLVDILEIFLGESKNGLSDDGQIQFNCPACAEDNCVPEGDGKFNLEINLIRGKFRCWACEHINGMSGKLSNLIKRYGNSDLLARYREEVNNIKQSKQYEMFFVENNLMFEEDEEFIVALPEKVYDFLFDGNNKELKALEYLNSRGITKNMIIKYNLKYTDFYCPNPHFRNRIIIPSYDKFGILNYYTGRDYTGKSQRKYYNFENSERKTLIFNEKFINWDGDVVLLEGPTDHLVVPNSIPLLGKVINQDFYLFQCIMTKSTQKIIVFLDNDATADALELCRRLSCFDLCGRIKIVPTEKIRKKLISEGYDLGEGKEKLKLDPSKLYKLLGYKGITMAIKMAEEFMCI